MNQNMTENQKRPRSEELCRSVQIGKMSTALEKKQRVMPYPLGSTSWHNAHVYMLIQEDYIIIRIRIESAQRKIF